MQHDLQVAILKELMQQLDDGKNVDAGVQYRMPTRSYICAETAARERQEFFQNHPQFVGLSQDLPEPGTFFTMDDFGTPILATRDKTGKFHAFLNACRHRSVKVASEERGKKQVFMCPFHHWSYANTGDLINIPDEDHFGHIDKSCHGLIKLPAQELHGMLWVHPQQDGVLDVATLLGKQLADEMSTYDLGRQAFAAIKTIDMRLNWKFANDTFGETYHFPKLHKDTLGQLYYGNNLHFKEFGRHHRFVTASLGIDLLRELPESEWEIARGTFVMYHLFPNVQILTSKESTTLIRIYPHPKNPSRSTTRINFYYAPELIEQATQASEAVSAGNNVYNMDIRRDEGALGSLQASLEVFKSTVEQEDYVMGEMQQRAGVCQLFCVTAFNKAPNAVGALWHSSHGEPRPGAGWVSRRSAEARGKLLDSHPV